MSKSKGDIKMTPKANSYQLNTPAVVFIVPPGGFITTFSQHLGVSFLRAVLETDGIPSIQFMPKQNPTLKMIQQQFLELAPPLVGFTLYDSNLDSCRVLCQAIREVLPKTIFLGGGPSATFTPAEVLDRVSLDGCLRGAGEGNINHIIKAVLSSEGEQEEFLSAVRTVPNLVLRTDNGLIFTSETHFASFQSEYFACLDSIPSPYTSGIITTTETGLLTSRGCNQRCTFCSFATISGRKVYFHSVERVLRDIAALKDNVHHDGVNTQVSFFDDAFTLSPDRAYRICEGIVNNKLQMPFRCITRGDRINIDLLRIMKEAGFVSIGFGLESAVPKVLRAIGKVSPQESKEDPNYQAEETYLQEFRKAVCAAKEAGLSTSVSIIAGLPDEKPADLEKTLAFVDSLKVLIYSHNELSVLAGTPLFYDHQKYGIRLKRSDIGLGEFYITEHAFNTKAILPLTNSSVHAFKWQEAQLIVDALCGRPRNDEYDQIGAWAIIFHNRLLCGNDLAWLRERLCINGVLLFIMDNKSETRNAELVSLMQQLLAACIFTRRVVFLYLEERAGALSKYHCYGCSGEHEIELMREVTWPPGSGLDVKADGSCIVRVIIPNINFRVKAKDFSPNSMSMQDSDIDDTFPAQVADTCRWWRKGARCNNPQVLHVWEDGLVSACWNGIKKEVIKKHFLSFTESAVSDSVSIRIQNQPCPLESTDSQTMAETIDWEEYEIAAQMRWVFRPAKNKGGKNE